MLETALVKALGGLWLGVLAEAGSLGPVLSWGSWVGVQGTLFAEIGLGSREW